MCGIVGGISINSFMRLSSAMTAMLSTLKHRGPDDNGIWCDANSGVVLGHARLSILDLSPAGHQPMASSSGRYMVIYNGEIYNHLELRKKLACSGKAPNWRGHSDTETLLAAIEAWGLEYTLEQARGMFAIILWDRENRILRLARDRVGEKPLYYGWVGDDFVFASELKALMKHPAWQGDIDRNALMLFMRYGYVPTPFSIYLGISKLEPGAILMVPSSLVPQVPCPRKTQSNCTAHPNFPEGSELKIYWSATEVAKKNLQSPLQLSDAEATEQLDQILKAAVAEQMLADVPLGAFLSGGVDSSTIVALMQAQSQRPVKTFTIGFHEKGFNEANHAKAVAEYLGTDHTELYVSPRQAMDVIPLLPLLYDEPFADASQIPTFLVAQMTREHVTVALSGDGGDELFGGYDRYFLAHSLWGKTGKIPIALRKMIGRTISCVTPKTWDELFIFLGKVLPGHPSHKNSGDKLHKLAEVLGEESSSALYRELNSFWKQPKKLVIGGKETAALLTDDLQSFPNFIEQMMYSDLMNYLPDDILVKVDRAAMGVSLETRVPMLDKRVIEFSWQVPFQQKIRNNQGKWLLKEVLYKYVPKALIERPKMGFSIPLADWIRNDLFEWAHELYFSNDSKKFFEQDLLIKTWNEHHYGHRNWQFKIWNVLMFVSWYRRYSIKSS